MNFQKGEPFFLYINTFILAVVVLGFGSRAIMIPERLPPASLAVALHGISMLAWYILVIVQLGLIRKGNVTLHMRLGTWSLGLASLVLVTSPLVTVSNFQRTGDPMVVIANIVNMVNFTILYSLGIWKRFNAPAHKRLMTFASLAMVVPAAFRLFQSFGLSEMLSIPLWFGCALSVVVYDLVKTRKVHWVSVMGLLLFVAGTAVILNVGKLDSWKEYLVATIG